MARPGVTPVRAGGIMAKLRTYFCPGHGGTFDFMHHPNDEPPPRFCTVCGYDSEATMALAGHQGAPQIRSNVVKSADSVYRQMEAGADHRATMAMETMGLDAGEAASIRMTNMSDTAHEGEMSAIPVDNEVSRAMAAAPAGTVGNVGVSDPGIALALQGSRSGPLAGAGSRMIDFTRNLHSTTAHREVALGREGSFAG
jgi:hypothetical protein